MDMERICIICQDGDELVIIAGDGSGEYRDKIYCESGKPITVEDIWYALLHEGII